MANFQHLTPGQPIDISAGDWNAMIDMAKDYHQKRLSSSAPSQNTNFVLPGAKWVWVSNESPYDAQLGQSLVLDGLLNDPSTTNDFEEIKYRPTFKGVLLKKSEMNGWNHGYGRFGICAEAIKKGAIGRCVVSGWAIAQVNIMADWHFRCDVDFQWDERIFLRSYAGGTGRIVWKDTGRDAKWCVVSLGNNPVVKYYGTLLDTLKPNGSVQMTIYRWHHLNTWWTSTGWTEWVHCPPLIVNTTVSYGKKISAIWDAISHRLILDGYE